MQRGTHCCRTEQSHLWLSAACSGACACAAAPAPPFDAVTFRMYARSARRAVLLSARIDDGSTAAAAPHACASVPNMTHHALLLLAVLCAACKLPPTSQRSLVFTSCTSFCRAHNARSSCSPRRRCRRRATARACPPACSRCSLALRRGCCHHCFQHEARSCSTAFVAAVTFTLLQSEARTRRPYARRSRGAASWQRRR